MPRKSAAFCLLLGLAIAAWYGARRMEERRALHVTIFFDSASTLKPGSLVTASGIRIGSVTKVTPLEGQEAVSVRVEPGSRDGIRSDSLFSVEEHEEQAVLTVTNTISVGGPAADGAVLRARSDRFSLWLTRHGRKLDAVEDVVSARAGDLIRRYRSGELSGELDQYEKKWHQWKHQGKDVARHRLDQLKAQVDDLEGSFAMRRNTTRRIASEKLSTTGSKKSTQIPTEVLGRHGLSTGLYICFDEVRHP
ncbi:MAG: MlaD family protein [Acidobacteriota bacterium]